MSLGWGNRGRRATTIAGRSKCRSSGAGPLCGLHGKRLWNCDRDNAVALRDNANEADGTPASIGVLACGQAFSGAAMSLLRAQPGTCGFAFFEVEYVNGGWSGACRIRIGKAGMRRQWPVNRHVTSAPQLQRISAKVVLASSWMQTGVAFG